MNKIIAIVGPTACGKTNLSIKLAKKINGECINFDSTQIFKGTDIATNKIMSNEMNGIKHHLISIKEPNENIDVFEFRNIAREIINNLIKKNKTPILVGGTGFYLTAILKKYSFFGKKRNLNSFGYEIKNDDLSKIQKLVTGNDFKRLKRKQELIEQGINDENIDFDKERDFFYKNVILIGLNPERNFLYEAINQRVLKLIDQGLFDEIIKCYNDVNHNKDAQVLKCIGGKEIIEFYENRITKEKAIDLMQKNNRNYAKRQMTYFKNKFDNKIIWFNHNFINFDECCDEIINYICNDDLKI